MRYSSVKLISIAAGATALILFGAIALDFADERQDMRARAANITGGNPKRGEAMFIAYGCGGCHQLQHVRKATGLVGPPLDGIALRVFIAGRLENKPDNLQHWIRDPQAVSPGTVMPDLNVGQQDARDISAFLYTRN